MPEHNGYPHLIDLSYTERHRVLGTLAPAARLHVDRCACGADTVRPYDPELVAMMRDEYGVALFFDDQAREYVLALTFDPVARDDLASREVWPEGVPA